MNECLSRLLQRRSVPPRWLGEPGPSDREVEALLTVASRVPDHGKLVPWRFILIQGEARQRLGEVLATAFRADNPDAVDDQIATERERFAKAPLVVASLGSTYQRQEKTFAAIKAVFGLRVPDEDEDAGLDITEHGMYGYPEQFIPQSELEGYGAGIPAGRTPAPAYSTQEVPAT